MDDALIPGLGDAGDGQVLTHDGYQRPPQRAAGELGPRLGREAGVLAPHVPTPDAPVAAHPDEQRRGTPTHRLVRQRPGDGVARHALTPAPSAPAVVLHDAAGQHRPIRLQSLADDFQAEVIETSERGQVRASEGSVRHVGVFRMGGVRTSIIGRPRPRSAHRRADPLTPLLHPQL